MDDQDWGELDANLRKLLPRGMAIRYCALPLKRKGRILVVAMPDPTNIMHREDLENFTGFRIEGVQKEFHEIIESIREFYSLSDQEYEKMKTQSLSMDNTGGQSLVTVQDLEHLDLDLTHSDYIGPSEETNPKKNNPVTIEPSASTIELINGTLNRAVEIDAQEIHVDLTNNGLTVRYRIEGNLITDLQLPKIPGDQFCYKLLSMAELSPDEQIAGTGSITSQMAERTIVYFLRWHKTFSGNTIHIKICDTARIGASLSQLGCGHAEEQFMIKASRRPHGLILCASPPHQGKTTTMLTLIRSLNLENTIAAIITDPIEYLLNDVQYFTPRLSGMSYEQAAEFLVKGGADVMAFEDIDVGDCAGAALKTALTTPTLATLKARDCLHALLRISPSARASLDLRGLEVTIICQRLVNRLCERCRQPSDNAVREFQKLGIEPKGEMASVCYEPVGCKFCNFTGFHGYCGLFQTLYVSDELKAAFVQGGKLTELRKIAMDQGMTSMRELGIELVLAGQTSADEVLIATLSSED